METAPAIRHHEIDEIIDRLVQACGAGNMRNTSAVSRSSSFFPFDPSRDEHALTRRAHEDELNFVERTEAIPFGQALDDFDTSASLSA